MLFSAALRIARAPSRSPLGHLGWLRGALGAAIGVAASAGVGIIVLGTAATPALPWLVGPTGASAVLVFAVPASPLAQPWSLIGGSLIAAAIGLGVGHMVGTPLVAAAIAVAMAIGAMSLAGCLHPPGGACALLYALGASGPEAWGPLHLLVIVANVLALAGVAWVYNNLTGHHWPHRAAPVPGPTPRSARSAAIHQALTEVMAEWDEVIDADIDDLDAIFQAVERRVRSQGDDAPPVMRI